MYASTLLSAALSYKLQANKINYKGNKITMKNSELLRTY